MKPIGCLAILLSLACLAAGEENSKPQVFRGWLSDESCARGRASSGTYTGTNPQCANECIAKGKKIVFIDPNQKRVLVISNQAIAKNNVGDQVEITAILDSRAKTLRVMSLKMLEKGAAMCARTKQGE